MDATPEEMWSKFIDHLNKVQPLGKPNKETGECPKHMNFIGSISAYKKVFLEANKDIGNQKKLPF